MNNVKAFLLFGLGYLLVFASFYRHGQYADRPWQALQA